jgi:methionyl-tRNA synthetase
MGKSLGNAVDPQEVAARFGADALRWYLLREIPPTTDSDFAVARLVARYNTDLANDLGNLLNRTNAMVHRYRGGLVPEPPRGAALATALAELNARVTDGVAAAMEAYDPRRALDVLWELVAQGNRAVDEAAPWTLHRAEKAGDRAAAAALDGTLYALLETLRLVAVHLEPFLPGPAARMLEALGVAGDAARPHAERVRWGGLPAGGATPAPTPLFPRIEAGATPEQVAVAQGATA